MPKVAFALASLAGEFLSVDEHFCSVIHREERDVLGRTILDVTLGADRQRNAAKLDALRHSGEPFTIRKHYLGADGRVIPVENHVSLLADGGDEPKLVASIANLCAGPKGPLPQRELLALAKAIVGERRLRSERLGQLWCDGFAWEIVLAAYISELEGHRNLIDEVVARAVLPPAEARAMLMVLVQKGVLILERRSEGKQQEYAVRLAEETVQSLEDHLASLRG